MRSTMRSRSWGSFVPPTDRGPAPWPRSTMGLYHDISIIDLMVSLCGAGHRSGSSAMAFILPGLQVHDARAGAHAHRPARHASRAAGARAGASE